MKFQDYKEETKKAGMGGDFFRCKSGENKIRILGYPESAATHFNEDAKKSYTCTLDDDCIYCKKNMQRSFRVWLYILDREDNTIKLGELPWSLYKKIGELSINSEYSFGELPPFDLIVTKTGEKLNTKYAVMPGKNIDPLTEEQIEELAGKKSIYEIVVDRIDKARADQKEINLHSFKEEIINS